MNLLLIITIVSIFFNVAYLIEADNATTLTTIKDNTTTTVISPTTTEPVKTTTLTPGPKPNPDIIPKYEVKEGDVICILLQTRIEIIVPYYQESSESTSKFILDGISEVNVKGTCAGSLEQIIISWKPTGAIEFFDLAINFSMTPDNFRIVNSFSFSYFLTDDVFPKTNETGEKKVSASGDYFKTPESMYYQCNAKQTVSLASKGSPVNIAFSQMKMESFRKSSNDSFAKAYYSCSEDHLNVVPIVVGVILALIIVGVLIAFLVGKRFQQSRYQRI